MTSYLAANIELLFFWLILKLSYMGHFMTCIISINLNITDCVHCQIGVISGWSFGTSLLVEAPGLDATFTIIRS